jgi:hypothetical protein
VQSIYLKKFIWFQKVSWFFNVIKQCIVFCCEDRGRAWGTGFQMCGGFVEHEKFHHQAEE